jgi:dethiobiotin synthetase
METVERLSGVTDTHELARFPDPLSPEAAARAAGLPPLDMAAASEYIAKLARSRDLILVEGAGGLLVRYDGGGATIADLAKALGAPVLIVAAADLGTLNHTALTCEALAGVLPEGSAGLGRADFLAAARSGLMPRLGGARPAS